MKATAAIRMTALRRLRPSGVRKYRSFADDFPNGSYRLVPVRKECARSRRSKVLVDHASSTNNGRSAERGQSFEDPCGYERSTKSANWLFDIT